MPGLQQMAEVCQAGKVHPSEPPTLVLHVAEVMGGRSMFILSNIDFLEPIGNFSYYPSSPSSVVFCMKYLLAQVLRVFSVFRPNPT